VRRLDGIQAMRLVAALLVVGTHSTLYAHDRMDSGIAVWRFGQIGVPIFFTISGIVMVVSSERHRREPGYWREFALRRLIRIGPMYWLATTVKLATLLLLPATVLYASLDPWNLVASYFFLPSYNASGTVEPFLGVGWTLVFEMGFYALFSLALALRSAPVVFCAPVLVGLSLLAGRIPVGAPAVAFYCSTVVMYFLAGMAIGQHAVVSWRPGRLAVWLTLATAVMVASYRQPGSGEVALTPVVRFAGVAVVLTLVVTVGKVLNGRIPRAGLLLGDASYSMYLFHPLVAPLVPLVLHRLGLDSLALSVGLSLVLVAAVSVLLYTGVERRLTSGLNHRLLPRRQRPSPLVSELGRRRRVA
jgi:exopolysaccharide production protein ExoZ